MMSVDERYMTDPVFRQLVDMLESLLDRTETTPTEIREACMLALIHYEQRRPPRPWYINARDVHDHGDGTLRIALNALRDTP